MNITNGSKPNGYSYSRLNGERKKQDEEDTSIQFEKYSGSNNPFEVKQTWDGFKKEYYQLEKKVKKSLENLHMIQIEFTKLLSLMESKGGQSFDQATLYNNFQQISKEVRADITAMKKLLDGYSVNKGGNEEVVKQNMLRRFREIHQEHEKEYQRLNSSIDLNKKKLELFNDTLKLGELKFKNKSHVEIQIDQNKSIQDQVKSSSDVIKQGNLITQSFSRQTFRLSNVKNTLKNLSEEFSGVSELLKKIKYVQVRQHICLGIIVCLLALLVIYKIVRKFV